MKNKRGIKKSEQQLFLKACIMAEVYMSFETFCNVSITEIQNQCQNPAKNARVRVRAKIRVSLLPHSQPVERKKWSPGKRVYLRKERKINSQ